MILTQAYSLSSEEKLLTDQLAEVTQPNISRQKSYTDQYDR